MAETPDNIWGNIFRDRRKHEGGAVELLKKVPLFEGLKDRELAKVAGLMHHRDYGPDEVIFNQGIPGFGMYIIEHGRVKIYDEPSGRLLAELSGGEFFGELALLASAPRSAAAVSAEPSRLLGFFHSDLESLVSQDPKMGVKIAMNLAGIIGERLKRTNEQLVALRKEYAAAEEPGVPETPDEQG